MPYVQPWWKSTRTLIQRQLRILKRLHMLCALRAIQVCQLLKTWQMQNNCLHGLSLQGKADYRFFQACILGIFAGTLFYKLGGKYNLQHMNSVRALGFVSTMSILLINMPQLPLYMLQRPTFYKHRDQRFFRTSSYVVAHCITNLPQAFIEVISSFDLLGHQFTSAHMCVPYGT